MDHLSNFRTENKKIFESNHHLEDRCPKAPQLATIRGRYIYTLSTLEKTKIWFLVKTCATCLQTWRTNTIHNYWGLHAGKSSSEGRRFRALSAENTSATNFLCLHSATQITHPVWNSITQRFSLCTDHKYMTYMNHNNSIHCFGSVFPRNILRFAGQIASKKHGCMPCQWPWDLLPFEGELGIHIYEIGRGNKDNVQIYIIYMVCLKERANSLLHRCTCMSIIHVMSRII